MCFSAPVSFTTGLVISTIGILAVRHARQPEMRLFAAVPLLFGIQQLTEGFIWLALAKTEAGSELYGLAQFYAFFIGVLWPILFPLSLMLLEPHKARRRLMGGLLVPGVGIAIYTLVVMGLYGFSVQVEHQCLVYQNPAGTWPGMEMVYLLVVCGAFFIASDHRLHWIGVANLAGFGFAASFFALSLPSVWCFCAAVLSSLIYWYVRSMPVGASQVVAEHP